MKTSGLQACLLGGGCLLRPAHLGAQGAVSETCGRCHMAPSGIPFLARFTDVAQAAGLTEPTIFGGIDRKDYIVETLGCG